jgi:hypothetical protein
MRERRAVITGAGGMIGAALEKVLSDDYGDRGRILEIKIMPPRYDMGMVHEPHLARETKARDWEQRDRKRRRK